MSLVFIVSAPSGSGKSTLLHRVLSQDKNLIFSVSYTTRARRGQERDGVDYHYISREEFEASLARDEFLEHAEVFGNYYGTHRCMLDRAVAEHKDLVLDIDVQGAAQLKGKVPGAVSIFILVPSRTDLEARLRARSEDSEEVIARRLKGAAAEIRNYRKYDYVLVNRDLDQSADTLASIFKAERVRRSRMEEEVCAILSTFER
ncbi:MAG: guanylate kinase [Bryobacteraceae bacterium]